jgi:hypothetical protein
MDERKMKLDYLHNINEFGENIVRFYDFDRALSIRFRDALKEMLLEKRKELNFSDLDFIERMNCNLILRLSEEDEGISSEDLKTFYCDLSLKGYEEMLRLVEPFCHKETKGHQWLYDVDNPTDLLFSPAGT